MNAFTLEGIKLQGFKSTFNASYDERGNLLDAVRIDPWGKPQAVTCENTQLFMLRVHGRRVAAQRVKEGEPA